MSKEEILNTKLAIPNDYVSIKDLISILKKGYDYYKNITPEEKSKLDKLNKNQEIVKDNSIKDVVDAMEKNKETIKENKGISGIIFKEGASDYMVKGLVYLRTRLKYVEKCIKSAQESKDNSKLLKYQTEKGDIISAIAAILHNRGNKKMTYKRNNVKESNQNSLKLIEQLEKLTGKKVSLTEGSSGIKTSIDIDNNFVKGLKTFLDNRDFTINKSKQKDLILFVFNIWLKDQNNNLDEYSVADDLDEILDKQIKKFVTNGWIIPTKDNEDYKK